MVSGRLNNFTRSVVLTNIKWVADQTDPPVGGRGLKLFMIQEIRENQRCLHQRYQRSNP
jgi:hypothetical protein